ncbi:bifunctional hydroxymethylpyrimidine kinase/phosphomethylpyrimidine kinase [Geobacter sp. FeAm09]|uniref:bifunctional hydroxymethylpyrimidine kinase/phosphomethylpyrimidine kinase n=1 Tax=Geobacter sp. FeAm09 TaxID=2597769 RepID=UPI0011ED0649|nr:bifunctional hydroxymethylpyrimidine kinase/phosphomethylpyrimidine kinase [Geobacter sp. FeAm09]QEM67388.1 bifunctional hydroxymethylpyrimidine kinase/phosphomethylpyrimidine kinase [Geobacter sp. FeAm09]
MGDCSRRFRLVINNTTHVFPPVEGVYLITDQGDNLVERVRTALRGGVAVLQYRAKEKSRETLLAEGSELKQLCRRFGVIFIVNDDTRLAKELDADGVHLGQDDGAIAEARMLLGPGKIVGKSTHNLEEALQAEQEGADYIGFGAMYPTDSKVITHMPGTSGLCAIRDRIKLPVVAIGGITTSNACRVIDAGADAVAVISSVLSSPRPDIAAAELKLLFNRTCPHPRGSVLTVAGSDSGGGAGIQADIKTITLLGSYAASALTALTAQNTKEVSAIHGLPPSFVMDQITTVLADIPVDVIKTGMLHTAAIVSALAELLAERSAYIPLVIDPVMISKGGTALLDRDAIRAMQEHLLPQAYLLTPNIPEAERLLGRAIRCEADMEQAARDLHALGPANVLLKGGHLAGRQSTDILFDGYECREYAAERAFTSNTHGTGCTYASAIAAFLAQGEPLKCAVEKAKEFISAAIRLAHPLGRGHSPVNHFAAARQSDR